MRSEIFRLLYCCGKRISEVLQLKVEDMDLGSGVLIVRVGRFNKDRLVPMAPSKFLGSISFCVAFRRPYSAGFPGSTVRLMLVLF